MGYDSRARAGGCARGCLGHCLRRHRQLSSPRPHTYVMCIYIYIYTHTHIHIYTHTHTHMHIRHSYTLADHSWLAQGKRSAEPRGTWTRTPMAAPPSRS